MRRVPARLLPRGRASSASDHAGRGAGGRHRRTGARAGGVRVIPVGPVGVLRRRVSRRAVTSSGLRLRTATGMPATSTRSAPAPSTSAPSTSAPSRRPQTHHPSTPARSSSPSAPPRHARPTARRVGPRRGRGGLPAADARAAGRAAVHGRHPRHRRERADAAGGRPPARGVGHPDRPQLRGRGGDAGVTRRPATTTTATTGGVSLVATDQEGGAVQVLQGPRFFTACPPR